MCYDPFNDDRKLTEGLVRGDLKAFNSLYQKYEFKLLTFSKGILKDEEAAKDAVQQVFIKIWEKRETLAGVDNFDGYLFTMSKNLIYNSLRRKVYDFAFKNYYKETAQYLVNSTEWEVNFNEVNEIITDMVEKLPPKRKHIFELSRFKGLTNKEIAQNLNTSTSFVENQINKAIKSLKANLRYKEIISLVFLIVGV